MARLPSATTIAVVPASRGPVRLNRQGLGGGRPAALAALLTEAPQCVPFEQRVLVFRSLVAADKERCAPPGAADDLVKPYPY